MLHVACRLFELNVQQLLPKELLPLQGVGPQKCLAFSTDGSRFATGGMVNTLVTYYCPSSCTVLVVCLPLLCPNLLH